jgi:hypothetical protein
MKEKDPWSLPRTNRSGSGPATLLSKHGGRSLFTVAEGKTDEDRIVGGYTAAENKPWVAKVFLKKFNSICGGTLINKRYNSFGMLNIEHKHF